MDHDERAIRLGRDLAEVLGLERAVDRAAAAGRLAELAGLQEPRDPQTQRVLAEILVALQRHVIDDATPLDRAELAHYPLTIGAREAGPDAVRTGRDELGSESLDVAVRRALYSPIATGLADRGAIRLVGG